jgi:hypothetical protein
MLSHQQGANLFLQQGQENATNSLNQIKNSNSNNNSNGASKSVLGDKENTSTTFKTPARRQQQRQALGNITNKTPKTGGSRRAFGEVLTPKTPFAGSSSAQRQQQRVNKGGVGGLSELSGGLKKSKSVQKQPASAGRHALGSSRKTTKSLSQSQLLAREVERRADLFAEEGVEFWMGESFEDQERKRSEDESKQVRQSVQETQLFMKGKHNHNHLSTTTILEKEECGDAPPVSFEQMSEADEADLLGGHVWMDDNHLTTM